jgi:formylglycine-generating enzyme required for sulfatase activity
VKKISLPILYCLMFYFTYAQNAGDNFRVYSQSMPGSNLSFKMLPIPAGKFLLGSAVSDKNREAAEQPQKNIQLSAFWMSAFEVTRDEFDVFLKDETTSLNTDVDAITRPSPQYIDFSLGMGKEGGYPANSMSQYSAIMYCRWLYQKTGVFYRLPTEAEWEYACRAGTNTIYYFGNDAAQLTKYAWYADNSNDKFQKVGQKLPNAWGLFDMLGNLMEWTLDHYTPSRYTDLPDNSKDPMVAANPLRYPKVLRGGSYERPAVDLRVAKRFSAEPAWNRRDPQIPKSKWWLTEAAWAGFRVVRPQKAPTVEEADEFFKQYLSK